MRKGRKTAASMGTLDAASSRKDLARSSSSATGSSPIRLFEERVSPSKAKNKKSEADMLELSSIQTRAGLRLNNLLPTLKSAAASNRRGGKKSGPEDTELEARAEESGMSPIWKPRKRRSASPVTSHREMSRSKSVQLIPQGRLTPGIFSKDLGQLPELRNGEDTVAYFAKHGDSTPLKFVFLNRAKVGRAEFKPYTLVVIPSDGSVPLNKEFFVFSNKGVMHCVRDPAQDHIPKSLRKIEPTETLSLAQWVREATNFRILRSISTFKNYLIWKMLKLWKISVRYAQYCRTRKHIAQKLFFLKPAFIPSILRVWREISAFRKKILMDLSMKRTVSISLFENMQSSHLEICDKELDEVMTNSSNAVEKVESVLEAKLAALYKKVGVTTSNSMAGQRLEKEATMLAISDTKEDKRRFLDFKRYMDNIIVGSLYTQALETYETFIHMLCNDQRGCTFRVVVNFGETDMNFAPTKSELISRLDEQADSMLAMLNGQGRIDLGVNPPPVQDPGDLVRNDATMIRLRGSMRSKFEQHFVNARDYSQSFESYRAIFEFASKFTGVPEDQRNNFDKISEKLSLVQSWTKDISKMRAEKTVGTMIMLDSRGMKDSLNERLQRPLNSLKLVLIEFGRAKSMELIDTMSRLRSKLQITVEAAASSPSPPGSPVAQESQAFGDGSSGSNSKSMSAHANFVKDLNNAEKSSGQFTQTIELVHHVYHLLAKMEVKIPLDDRSLVDAVDESSVLFTQSVESAQHHVRAKRSAYSDKLTGAIQKLEEKCAETTAQLNQPPFTDSEKHPAEVMQSLSEVKRHVESLRDRTLSYADMRGLFDGDTYSSTPLNTLEMVLERKHAVWSTYNEWETQYGLWEKSNLRALMNPEHADNKDGFNGPALEKSIDEYFSRGSAFNRQMKGDSIVAAYLKNVGLARKRAPYIAQLGHPSLESRHWVKIYTVLGQGFSESNKVKLKDLASWGVFEEDKMEEIDSICGVAGKEYSLVKAMDKMEIEWKDLVFGTLEYKDTGTSILTSVEEIEQVLDDQIVRSQAMRGSRYIKPFEGRLIKWEKMLHLLEDIIANWLKVQGTWLYLEPIFSSPDIRKQMPAEAKRFLTVDKIWRETMQNVIDDPAVLSVTEEEGMLDRLVKSNSLLDTIQKGLADYLNEKSSFRDFSSFPMTNFWKFSQRRRIRQRSSHI